MDFRNWMVIASLYLLDKTVRGGNEAIEIQSDTAAFRCDSAI
jgi:hypothetical protein